MAQNMDPIEVSSCSNVMKGAVYENSKGQVVANLSYVIFISRNQIADKNHKKRDFTKNFWFVNTGSIR